MSRRARTGDDQGAHACRPTRAAIVFTGTNEAPAASDPDRPDSIPSQTRTRYEAAFAAAPLPQSSPASDAAALASLAAHRKALKIKTAQNEPHSASHLLWGGAFRSKRRCGAGYPDRRSRCDTLTRPSNTCAALAQAEKRECMEQRLRGKTRGWGRLPLRIMKTFEWQIEASISRKRRKDAAANCTVWP